jgi:pimeloyl-ACP methyl ester carboxylesterase
VWPIPPLDNVVGYRELAFEESRFAEVDGIDIHYVSYGGPAASEQTTCGIILLHGFGGSVFTFRDVGPALAERAPTFAYDRPSFGITERPERGEWDSDAENPYGLTFQADQLIDVMDQLGYERAVLVGHSAGAATAVLAAARHPDRVAGIVLVAPAVYQSRPLPGWLRSLLSSPQMMRIGPYVSRTLGGENGRQLLREAFYDPSFLTEDLIASYKIDTRAEGWDVALWEFTVAPRPDDPADALSRISVPTLVVAGEEDTTVPYDDAVTVAESIEDAALVTYERTGHVPHEEQTERFISDVLEFLDTADIDCGETSGSR